MNQTLIALDQLLNTVFKGWADETISARAYRNSAQGKEKWQIVHKAIDMLFFWQHKHCRESFYMEQKRMQLPPAYRTNEP